MKNSRTRIAKKPGSWLQAWRQDEAGFSLVELMIVVGILLILTMVAIPSFTAIKNQTKLAAASTESKNFQKEIIASVDDDATYNDISAAIQSYVNSRGDTDDFDYYRVVGPKLEVNGAQVSPNTNADLISVLVCSKSAIAQRYGKKCFASGNAPVLGDPNTGYSSAWDNNGWGYFSQVNKQ